MSKIRYLSDGALRYIKGRLDSIEKKINGGGNVTTPKDCKILNISTNNIITYYNLNRDTTEIISMSGNEDYINGNIAISVDGEIYNITAFIIDNKIYSNNGCIGKIAHFAKPTIGLSVEVTIDCIINNKKINIITQYKESVYRDISSLDNEYFMDYNNNIHKLNDERNTFILLYNAKCFVINDFCYVVKSFDTTNRIITLMAISAPLSNYNFEIQIEVVVNNGIKIKSKNSDYLNIEP